MLWFQLFSLNLLEKINIFDGYLMETKKLLINLNTNTIRVFQPESLSKR